MRAARLTLAIFFVGLFGLASCAPPPAAPPPPRPVLELINNWGTEGDGPGQLKRPVGLAVDDVGNLFIADAGNLYVHKFNAKGSPLLSFNDLRMKEPAGIALDSGGAIYVPDLKRNSVLIFLPDGRFFREIRGGPGQRLQSPVSVAADIAGNIYVAERDANRIQKFDARGRFVVAWGKAGAGPGDFRAPAEVRVGAHDGYVYVADAGNQRVQKFTPEGAFVAEWKNSGPADSSGGLSGLSVASNLVFGVNGTSHGIEMWDTEGKPLHAESLAARLNLTKDMPTPRGVALGPKRELYILDPAGPRILEFRLNF